MWCFWSAKGGVGCTVAVVAAARGSAANRPTLVVDLAGDVAAAVGVGERGDGLARWLGTADPPIDALSRLEVEVAPGLSLVSWGAEPTGASGPCDPSGSPGSAAPGSGGDGGAGQAPVPADVLARLIDAEARPVLVDLGQRGGGGPARAALAERLLSLAGRSTLVTRACYLAVRAAQRWPAPDEVVVVARAGRVLRADDVARALDAPVAAEVRWDPAVARSVDAGLLAARGPRSLRPLERLGTRPEVSP